MRTERTPVVGDLLAINQHLVIECAYPACRHKARWSAVEAVQRLGRTTPIDGLRLRLRCASCGRRGRHGFITCRPCTLDADAHRSREQHATGLARGQPVAWDLDETLAKLERLAGGPLGGDGPARGP